MGLYPHTIGLDLGQSADYTAIAILEEAYWLTEAHAWDLCQKAHGWVWPSQLASAMQIDAARSWNYHGGRPANPPLALVHLERIALGTSYPAIVERVTSLIQAAPLRLRTTPLVVDQTGVGAPVCDLFRQAGLGPAGVVITAGNTVNHEPDDDSYRVPKRDLVSTMSVLLEQRRLRIPRSLPLAELLVKELQEFKRRITPAGGDTYASGREGVHDDLVLAVSLAAWHREWTNALIERANATAHR